MEEEGGHAARRLMPPAATISGIPVILAGMVKKVVVIGPESTGKSTLCEMLAQHYGVSWCPEFAREYLLTYGKEYGYDDLLTIAKGQLAMEDEFASMAEGGEKQAPVAPLLFIDTDMYVMKVWCEFVFGKCHAWILEQIVNRSYDLYLLCNTDLPWVKDELREYPDLATRETLFRMYEDILINQGTPWQLVSGAEPEGRFRTAVQAVDGLWNG
jgi:NadR type nicotinamide-nucleotide adenylyltransferase